jgi:hypothetical protein
MTRALKDMILQALDDVGGQQYLAEQAAKNPAAFMTLLGRVLPLTLAGDASEPLTVYLTQYHNPPRAAMNEGRQYAHAVRRGMPHGHGGHTYQREGI